MQSSPYLLKNEASDPSFAFDCVNLFDRGMRGIARVQDVFLEAATQSNLDAVQVYQQALWFVPSMFLFDSFGPIVAGYIELQTSMVSLLTEQAKLLATLQVDLATAPLSVAASALSRGMDVNLSTFYEGTAAETTAAAA